MFVIRCVVILGIATGYLIPVQAFSQVLLDTLDNDQAKTSASHHHVKVVTSLIDGAQHPELIPDSTAYRLFLIMVSEPQNATAEESERQLAFLRAAGLEDADIQAAIPILAKFKVRYSDLMKRYNASVDRANAGGSAPGLANLLRSRDRLVQTARDQLAAVLSEEAISRFHAHIQKEKTGMTIPAKEGQ
jgi:hypothetical protein